MTGQLKNIEETARALALEVGLINVTKRALCDAVGISPGSFRHITGLSFLEFIGRLNAAGIPDKMIITPDKKRVPPSLRREAILSAALIEAEAKGYGNVTREDIAERAGVSAALITSLFGTMPNLKRDIIRAAIRRECLPVIAQAVILRDPRVSRLDLNLKAKALTWVGEKC